MEKCKKKNNYQIDNCVGQQTGLHENAQAINFVELEINDFF
jgi:hypothetical protein